MSDNEVYRIPPNYFKWWNDVQPVDLGVPFSDIPTYLYNHLIDCGYQYPQLPRCKKKQKTCLFCDRLTYWDKFESAASQHGDFPVASDPVKSGNVSVTSKVHGEWAPQIWSSFALSDGPGDRGAKEDFGNGTVHFQLRHGEVDWIVTIFFWFPGSMVT